MTSINNSYLKASNEFVPSYIPPEKFESFIDFFQEEISQNTPLIAPPPSVKEIIIEPIKPKDDNEALEIAPDELGALITRGNSYLLLGKLDEAHNDLKKALEIDPTNQIALSLLTKLNHKKDLAKARNTDKKTKKGKFEDSSSSSKNSEEIRILSEKLLQNPTNVDALARRAELYRVNNRHDQALRDYNEIIKISIERASANLLIPPDQDSAERNKKIGEALNKAPHYVFARCNRGCIYFRQHWAGSDQLEKALVDFNEVIRINPNDAFALFKRGQVYAELEKYNEALKDFDKILQIEQIDLLKREYEAHYVRPDREEVLKKLEEHNRNAGQATLPAQEIATPLTPPNNNPEQVKINQTLELPPQQPEGMPPPLYPERSTWELTDLNGMVFQNPNNVFALTKRAELYGKLGQDENALSDLNEILKILTYNALVEGRSETLKFSPDYVHTLAVRIHLFQRKGRFNEALQDLNEILLIYPDHVLALTARADVYRRQGKFEKALTDINRALQIEPTNSAALSLQAKVSRDQQKLPNTRPFPLIPNNSGIDAERNAPHVNIDPKYLPGTHTRLPEMLAIGQSSPRDWLEYPSLTLHEVGKNTSAASSKLTIHTPEFTGTYMTENLRPLSPEERCTFVMLGRRELGRAPTECEGGRVILVVPKEDAEAAAAWIGPNRDVLVIHSLKKEFIGNNTLGLVTVRRFAALSFAMHYGLKHMIMTDDNIESLYVSGHFVENESADWKGIYQLFQSASLSSNAACVSARTYRREIDKNRPDAADIAVDTTKFGSKIFYIDLESLKSKVKNPQDLLPDSADLWGEDFFFQYAMHFAGLNVGILKRNAFLFTRCKTSKNICKKVIRPAAAWLDHQASPNRPQFAMKAEEILVSEVKRNISKSDKHELKIALMDLGILTEKLQNKRRTEAIIPLDVALETKEEVKKKRSNKTSNVLTLESGDESSDSVAITAFLQEISETLSLIVPTERECKPIDCMILGEKEIYIPQPYRDNQRRTFDALASALQRGIRCGYIEEAPGTGKTRIFSTLTALAMLSPKFKKNVLIVTPTLELIEQTYDEVTKFYSLIEPIPKAKVIKVSHHNLSQQLLQKTYRLNDGGHTIICCDRSLKKLLTDDPAILNHFGLIVIDESHEIPADILKIGQQFADNQQGLTLNFTATPGTKRALMGKCIYNYAPLEGVQEKILCPWIIHRIGVNFTKDALQAFFISLPRILGTQRHPHGGVLAENKGIMYVPTVEDAENLEKLLRDNGVKAASTHYKKNNNETILNEFKKDAFCSEVNFLIAVDKLKIGFDAKVDYVIIARNSLPQSDWLQILGRALRFHVPTPYRGEELAGMKVEQQKIAYLMVFDGVELPAELLQHFEKLALNQDYLAQNVKYNHSLRRKATTVEKIDFKPSSPALSFEFSNAEYTPPLPITLDESALIPVQYGNSQLDRAVGLGALLHEKAPTDEEIKTNFGIVRALCTKHPVRREKLRKNEKSSNDDVLISACQLLNQKAQEISLIDALVRYQIQVFEHDPAANHFRFRNRRAIQNLCR